MKTFDAVSNDRKCPRCGGHLSGDPSGKGYVRHLEHGPECDNGEVFGVGERD